MCIFFSPPPRLEFLHRLQKEGKRQVDLFLFLGNVVFFEEPFVEGKKESLIYVKYVMIFSYLGFIF